MITLPLILGMSGGEIALILFVAVMIFGPEKIPEVARNLGKGIRSIRNATDEIKSEITKSAQKGNTVKDEASKSVSKTAKEIKEDVDKVKKDIEKITGSVKRRF